MVGAAIALMRESGDHTFRRADQIEAMTGLPVIAMIPQISGRTPPAMQVLRQPTSIYSEALRRLHIGVELSETAESPRTIMFSSATPSEGKSVMVSSLGRLLASNGKRVLLIDCDWRSPRLHQIFHCGNRAGLASLLTDKPASLDEVIHHDALSGLDVMPAGPGTRARPICSARIACASCSMPWPRTTSSSCSTPLPRSSRPMCWPCPAWSKRSCSSCGGAIRGRRAPSRH